MKKIALVFFLIGSSLFSQNSSKTCELVSKINSLIQREHYHPKPVDDSLSVFVFDTFLDKLDGSRNLFTKLEYEKLNRRRLTLDNAILKNDCVFIDEFISIYETALVRKKSVLEKIQNTPLNYDGKDTVRFSKSRFAFDLEIDQLDRVWKKRIKYDILEDISKISSNFDSLNTHFNQLEKEAKTKILNTQICKINSLLNTNTDLAEDLQNEFLTIFCSYFDPHTNYFSLEAKSSFMSGLKTSGLSLGINISLNEKDEIIVNELVPGGPAARSENIEKGDTILKISNTKGVEHVVSCSPLDKIGELIFDDSNLEIEFTLQKQNGTIQTVRLKKQLLKATTNVVSSYIIEKDIKIGYINIPNFYSDFDGYSSQGCANDVHKEILKLTQDNVKGLIIDLQNNGGGSMDEAVKLAGMFIDYGALAILQNSKNKQSLIKDYNRGCIYYGPIVILINGNSASASEFFTGTMQDYNRALTIGSTSTGKASMQTILPLDGNKQNFVKLTVEKFYRITGDSNQIKGIIPDIALPTLFDSITQRENSAKMALKYDVIKTKVKYFAFRKDYYPLLIENSRLRTENNHYFNEIISINQEVNLKYNENKKPLAVDFINVFKDTHDMDSIAKKVQKIATTQTNCTITNNYYDSEKMKADPLLQEINSYRIKELKTNPYLEEAVAILNDYNKLKK